MQKQIEFQKMVIINYYYYHKPDSNPDWKSSKLYTQGCQQGKQPGKEKEKIEEREVYINTIKKKKTDKKCKQQQYVQK